IRPAAPAGAVHAGSGGPQGRRGRQRRHPGLGAADGRLRRGRTAVPAGQGGRAVGPGGVRRAQPVQKPWRARRRRAAPDAGPERHLPGLDPRRQPPRRAGPRLLRPPAEGLEVLRADRDDAPQGLELYARLFGWTLARAHARSGDRVALAAYLGGSAKFDQAIADFAETYADQNELDYAALQAAVKDGKAEATTGI